MDSVGDEDGGGGASDEEGDAVGPRGEPVGLVGFDDREVEAPIGSPSNVQSPSSTMKTSAWSWWCAGAAKSGGMSTVCT